MKFFTFKGHTGPRLGAVVDDRIGIDMQAVELIRKRTESPAFHSMMSLIESGKQGLEAAAANIDFARSMSAETPSFALNAIEYMAPIPQPVKLSCFSVYEKHMRQSLDAYVNARLGKFGLLLNRIVGFAKIPKRFYSVPTYYKGNTTSFIGHGAIVQWPSFDETKMDYEAELAVIIGKRGKDIKKGEVADYIWGYSIYNDFSARQRLLDELFNGQAGPLKGKDFHTGNAMGPWIVTADEIVNPQQLDIRAYVNDELRGFANTSEMYFSIAELIATASEGEYIVPGQIIATGAASNCTGIERWEFLQGSDVVRLEIEGLGVLRNSLQSVES